MKIRELLSLVKKLERQTSELQKLTGGRGPIAIAAEEMRRDARDMAEAAKAYEDARVRLVTRDDVQRLLDDAVGAGDLEAVRRCGEAIGGDREALLWCADALDAALDVQHGDEDPFAPFDAQEREANDLRDPARRRCDAKRAD